MGYHDLRMDICFELNGNSFVWNSAKAEKNLAKHGVRFEEAAAVFADPLFVLVEASRNDEARRLPLGSIHRAACFMWCILS